VKFAFHRDRPIANDGSGPPGRYTSRTDNSHLPVCSHRCVPGCRYAPANIKRACVCAQQDCVLLRNNRAGLYFGRAGKTQRGRGAGRARGKRFLGFSDEVIIDRPGRARAREFPILRNRRRARACIERENSEIWSRSREAASRFDLGKFLGRFEPTVSQARTNGSK